MMRQIKFKGKRIDNGEWVYGYAVEYKFMKSIAIFNPDEKNYDGIWVDPETVGQFTGLTGKNGVEIYENDIVQSYAYSNAVVRFDEYHCAFEVYCESNAEDDQHFYVNKDIGNDYDIEVIGNIHEVKQ